MKGKQRQESPDTVYALAASHSFAQDGVCFAARASGLYRSEDGGQAWTDAYRSLGLRQPLLTAAVALSPAFAADRTVFAGVSGGVLRSSDGGRTWTVVQLPSPPPFVVGIAVSPDFARDGVALAATVEDGVFRSGDRGASWAAWNFGLLDLNVLSLALSPAFGQDETAFAGTDSGIFRSTNGGRAWRDVDFPTHLAPVLSVALSPQYPQDHCLWAGTESSGLHRSTDGGRSWTRVGAGTIDGAVNQILLESAGQGDPAPAAACEIVVQAGSELFISHDGGDSWSRWEVALPTGCVLTAVIAPFGLGGRLRLLGGCADGSILRLGEWEGPS